ncbi:MAG TPA: hypothetical protein VKF40_00885 [Burkholderiales bacterium]|nr:hypothetical protein [Burkholderiales bacterium]
MVQLNRISEAERLEIEKRELEQLLRMSERARGVMAECNRVLAARHQNLTGSTVEAAELAALLRS